MMTRTGTSMLDLVETVLSRYGMQFLRYDGKMRSEARDATLIAFRKTGGPRVILISIKCGGVGLNLTIANRVIKYVLPFLSPRDMLTLNAPFFVF